MDPITKNGHRGEVRSGKRFEFGRNWKRFLAILNEERILEAVRSLKTMLGAETLAGKTFLDVGSGSGLFSLAARKLGAIVKSFDYDPQAVECTRELKRRYYPDDPQWTIEEGSALDAGYVSKLGEFDFVYSWGVLHHTGDMWNALKNICIPVASGGTLFIAIYNRQPFLSAYWLAVKKFYNLSPRPVKTVMELVFYVYFSAVMFTADILRLRNPMIRQRGLNQRGMSIFTNVVDWIGGLPFEVASPEEIFRFFRDRGFELCDMVTCAGKHGCNEYVFTKKNIERKN